ncbi:hypothetical protein ACIODS_27260 [Micromonospora chalcea]|uniref:hypothetical protein n=1 Tax=Micromonospora chalcea TaxID=1874 RepID=UPI00378F41ED
MQIPLEHDVPDKTFALNPFSIEGAKVIDEERSPAADISAASMTRLRSPFASEEPARERGPEPTAR